MSLRRKLREAERGMAKATHDGVEDRRVALDIDRGRRQSSRSAERDRSAAQSNLTRQDEGALLRKERTGIVSVNGRDVGEMRCTGGRRSA